MPPLEEKWKANQEKVAFAKRFPGLKKTWEECEGKRLIHVITLEKHKGAVLIMEDMTFTIVSTIDPDPAPLQEGILLAKEYLAQTYEAAYQELERLTELDRDLTRRSRLEKILGAIQNNISQIPDLKNEIRQLLDQLPD